MQIVSRPKASGAIRRPTRAARIEKSSPSGCFTRRPQNWQSWRGKIFHFVPRGYRFFHLHWRFSVLEYPICRPAIYSARQKDSAQLESRMYRVPPCGKRSDPNVTNAFQPRAQRPLVGAALPFARQRPPEIRMTPRVLFSHRVEIEKRRSSQPEMRRVHCDDLQLGRNRKGTPRPQENAMVIPFKFNTHSFRRGKAASLLIDYGVGKSRILI